MAHGVALWLCAYMHVLRQLGNEAAHENASGADRIPAIVAPGDLTPGLFCGRQPGQSLLRPYCNNIGRVAAVVVY